MSTRYIFKAGHDIQPDTMWVFGKAVAQLNYMTTGLIYTKKIPVTYVDTGEYEVEVTHYCDMRDYPEVCEKCAENYLEGKAQLEEDMYRERN